MEVLIDGRSQVRGNDGGECLQTGILHATQAAEVCNQAVPRLRAYAGNRQQVRLAIPDLSSLAVVRNGEAVGLIAKPSETKRS